MTAPYSSTIIPSTCVHGMAWAYPCASCNRPEPASAMDARAMYELAAAVRSLSKVVQELHATLKQDREK